jgi:hypothetical protein
LCNEKRIERTIPLIPEEGLKDTGLYFLIMVPKKRIVPACWEQVDRAIMRWYTDQAELAHNQNPEHGKYKRNKIKP